MIAAVLAAVLAALHPDPAGPRVIVQLGHEHFVFGTVIDRSANALHMLTSEGDEVEFDLATVMEVTDLIDVEQPVEVDVRLIDGRVIDGLLLADEWTRVRLSVEDVEMTFDRSEVEWVRRKPDIEAIFRRARSRIEDTDEAARLQLARWLMAHKSWTLAARELHMIADRFNSHEATVLLRRAEAHAQVEQNAPDTPASEEDTAAAPHVPEDRPPSPRLELPDERLVHLVRVMELDPLAPPAVRIQSDTRRRLHLGWGGNRLLADTDEGLRTLLAMDDRDVLRLMFDLRARPLYGEIDVLEAPPSLRAFAETVHDPWLSTRCGTRACHGGPDAGRFRLLRRGTVDDRLRTANLLLLERTTVDGEPMLDWAQPGRSLLVRYALGPDRLGAGEGHPRVPGWRPVLDDDRLEALLRWIRAMRQPRPRIDWPQEVQSPPTEAPSR